MPSFLGAGPRRLEPEIMDDPAIERGAHEAALRGLARLNRASGSLRILWTAIHRLASRHGLDGMRLLDVATGGGDLPIGLWHRARKYGLQLAIDGCDRSSVAVAYAARRAEYAGASVRFFQLDALRSPLPAGYDVVICSLFLHHLEHSEAVALLHKMAAAAQLGVFVNDLRRSGPGWLLACAAAHLLTRSPVVHVDAPRSARAAYTVGEVCDLAREAGLEEAHVQRRWPFRFLLTWVRP